MKKFFINNYGWYGIFSLFNNKNTNIKRICTNCWLFTY